MVVASPMPVRPSLQARRTITSVWRDIVVIASLWARMVGRSTSTASIDSMLGVEFMARCSLLRGSVVQYRLGPPPYLEGIVMELRHLRYFAARGPRAELQPRGRAAAHRAAAAQPADPPARGRTRRRAHRPRRAAAAPDAGRPVLPGPGAADAGTAGRGARRDGAHRPRPAHLVRHRLRAVDALRRAARGHPALSRGPAERRGRACRR